MAAQGVNVVAFDYASEMIRLAKKRWARFEDKITFCIADATEEESLLALRRERPFTKAVSNMAIMDITDVEVLFRCVNRLLTPEGVFVFATQHPCFVTRTEKYMTPHAYRGEAIAGQPQEHCYYHRSMQDLFQVCFRNGFVIDGFYEECYGKKETPDVIILRAVKRK